MSTTARFRVRADGRATVVEHEARGAYLRVDAEGRWTTWRTPDASLRRTLDGRVMRRGPGGPVALGPEAARRAHADVQAAAGAWLADLRAARAGEVEQVGETGLLLERLQAAASWDPARLEAETSRFHAAYAEGIPILPPHRYRDVVVLPALGCPNHACTFCAFYRDVPFRVPDPASFERHLEAVAAFFGNALAERDGVFLGSASATSLADPLLLDRMARTRRVLGRVAEDLASFGDPDRMPRRDARAWAALREAGLADVTLGLETGLPDLRSRLGKSADVERFVATVRDLKAAGLRVAVSVLLGAGGRLLRDVHRSATVRALARMGLAAEDLVFLAPLRGEATAEDDALWRRALREATPARPSAYQVETFAWWT